MPSWHMSLRSYSCRLLARSRIGLPVSGRSPRSEGHGPGRGRFMRLVSKHCGATVSLGLAIGLMGFVSGCDTIGSQESEYKPIETSILKKLGNAGQAQGQAARESHPQGKVRKQR